MEKEDNLHKWGEEAHEVGMIVTIWEDYMSLIENFPSAFLASYQKGHSVLNLNHYLAMLFKEMKGYFKKNKKKIGMIAYSSGKKKPTKCKG